MSTSLVRLLPIALLVLLFVALAPARAAETQRIYLPLSGGAATPTATATATPTAAPATATPPPTATNPAGLQPGHTQVGALTLAATYQSISLYANFANDDGDNQASFEYRKAGAAAWIPGMDMTVDRRANVTGNGTFANPFRNQWRASVLLTDPDTLYEVRVTFADPDGVAGANPVLGTVRTRAEDPPSTGATYHVAPTGNDADAGSSAAPWRTLQKAATSVVAGDTVVVHAGSYTPVTLARSGTATNPIRFVNAPGARPVVTGSSGTLVSISGSYVRLTGFELVGATWGVRVLTPSKGAVIERNVVRGQTSPTGDTGGVAVEIGDTFSTQNPVADVTVQDNDLRADALPEPQSEVVLVKAASGGHVIRRNRIVFSYQGGNVHGTDCVGGLPNFDPHGGFFKDTDVSDNYCDGATDEGIELDGGNANVRVWNNTVVRANGGFSVTPVHYGPVYVFRNVVRDLADHWIGSCFGVKDGEGGTGAVYFFHNTFTVPDGAPCDNLMRGAAKYGSGSAQANVVFKNNVLHFWGRLYETGAKTADYNLNFVEPASGDKIAEWNGTDYFSFASFRSGTGQETHGLFARPLFVDRAAGDFRLAAGSPGVDLGVALRAFNGPASPWPTLGNAPDAGAFESR
jgi:hypothetical protein